MEKTDWENRYRTGDTPWEKGAPHPALVDWLRAQLLHGRILVPGCGSGHDVRAIAATGAEVVGLDLAASAVETAQQYPRVGRETYVQGVLFALPAGWAGTFDAVVEHTCFCAISPDFREAYARSVASLIRPGGHFLAIFYLDPGHDEGGPPYGCTTAEIERLFSPAFRLLAEKKDIPTYPGREGREILQMWERLP